MKNVEKGFTCGIYKIINIINGKFYLGSSKKIEYRWESEHKRQLNKGTHVNIILQRAWNKYGSDNFKMEILEIVEPEFLLKREQFYLDKLKPKYNIGKHSTGGDNLSNHPDKKNIINRIKNTIIKQNKSKDPEYWKQWSEKYKGEKNPNYGNKWSDEQKKRNSNKLKEYYKIHKSYRCGKTNIELFGSKKAKEISKKISEFAKTRVGNKNPFYGKTHSDETKEKIRNARIGKSPSNTKKIQINNKTYSSLMEASKQLNISVPTIHYRINSSNKKFEKYKYLD